MTEEQYQKVLEAMTKYCEGIESGKGSIDIDTYYTFCELLERLPMTQGQIFQAITESLYG